MFDIEKAMAAYRAKTPPAVLVATPYGNLIDNVDHYAAMKDGIPESVVPGSRYYNPAGLDAMTDEQKEQAVGGEPVRSPSLTAGASFGYNPDSKYLDPASIDPDDIGYEAPVRDAEPDRNGWEPAGASDRGEDAVFGMAGLYSVMADLGPDGDALEDAMKAFFEDAKRIAQQSAMEEIYGPSAQADGKTLDEQSLDAVMALHDAVSGAGLDNASDRAQEKYAGGSVFLFDQEISADPATGDARAFIGDVMRVTQRENWTDGVEADLELMGKAERTKALLYREPDTVPESYGQDIATQEAVQALAEGLG